MRVSSPRASFRFLQIGGTDFLLAEEWDNDHVESIYAGVGTLDGLILRALRKKERLHES